MNLLEEHYKGYTIEVNFDEYQCNTENPRKWDNLGTIVYWHKNYLLGEIDGDKEFSSPDQFIKDYEKDSIMLPVYLYNHGGITINTHGFYCRWDSGQVGYIYVSKEKVRQEFSVKRIDKKLLNKVYDILNSEIKIFDQYLRGEIYSKHILDNEGNEIDSCYGYYDTDITEQKKMIDHIIEKQDQTI